MTIDLLECFYGRRYCTARLRRLYKSLKFTHGRGKYSQKVITESTVTDVRYAILIVWPLNFTSKIYLHCVPVKIFWKEFMVFGCQQVSPYSSLYFRKSMEPCYGEKTINRSSKRTPAHLSNWQIKESCKMGYSFCTALCNQGRFKNLFGSWGLLMLIPHWFIWLFY